MNLIRLIVQTPSGVQVDELVQSARVVTESGHVGVRPRMETQILAIEPGLVLARLPESMLYIGTAGGLMMCDGTTISVSTPLAVFADDEVKVIEELGRTLQKPSRELEVRNTIDRLQTSILNELEEDGRRRGQISEVNS